MNKRLGQTIAFLLVQILCMGVAAASGGVIAKPIMADTPEKFAEVAANIKAEFKAGGRYEFLNSSNRERVAADLDTMEKLLQKSGSVDALNQQDKLTLMNTQEYVNGLLAKSDRNRLVCERTAHMGSNIPTTSCKTVAEIERQRKQGSQMIGDKWGRW